MRSIGRMLRPISISRARDSPRAPDVVSLYDDRDRFRSCVVMERGGSRRHRVREQEAERARAPPAVDHSCEVRVCNPAHEPTPVVPSTEGGTVSTNAFSVAEPVEVQRLARGHDNRAAEPTGSGAFRQGVAAAPADVRAESVDCGRHP
jgi:hypothetical protein